jgi:lipopolysaccharide/colanic/teichoic acid biosynthesis glycosyltransferase
MSIKGSSPNIRQATRGGSLPDRSLNGTKPGGNPAGAWGDDDPSSFLRRVMVDLFQKQRAVPSVVDGHEGSNGSNGSKGNGALPAASEIPAISLPKVPVWKSVLDITFILLLLPVWLPLMVLMMLVTQLSSPGPIFYRQERVGLGGKRFLMWKFRTMKLSAETGTHERYFEELIRTDSRMTKLDASGDPRLVPFGRILRASGLDELPQIFNVLRGEMSLVGPRPCLPNEFTRYEPWQRKRVNALPGLTGYWQVNGKNNTTFNQMVEMDLSYLENMSISLDLKIMLMTGGAILAQLFESRD